jgi:uncharacterized protein
MERSQKPTILSDLKQKMVFLSGPRQVGKSYLAKHIAEKFTSPLYLNYDNPQDRDLIIHQTWRSSTNLIIFDEIHKIPQWKSFLKGIYDSKQPQLAILVTGSARLDTFRQSGDSLAGRYFQHRLLPISPGEAQRTGESTDLERFLERGGFPEPFLAERQEDAGRWRRQYIDGLIREDILSFENITQLKAMNLLVELLRGRVGSPLSYQSLSEDLGIAPNTVKRYIEVLEALYIVFRIYPHHRSIARSLLQQPKLYFFDIGLVKGQEGARLENLVALSILKELYIQEDRDGIRRDLRYMRTKEGLETDFIVCVEDEGALLVEVKKGESEIAPGLRYFHSHYGFAGVQVVEDLRLEREDGGISVRRAAGWLTNLNGSETAPWDGARRANP